MLSLTRLEFRIVITTLWTLFFCFLVLPLYAQTYSIKIDFEVDGTATKFYVRLPKNITPIHYILHNPSRVVFDFPEAIWAEHTRNINVGVVKKLRHYNHQGKISRIVLDLKEESRILNMEINPHPRLEDTYLMKVNLQSKTNFKKPVSYLQEKVIDSRNPNRNDLVKTIISTQNEKPKYQEKEFVIAIDAGHGGNDPGTHSTSGQYEKHIVLRFAKEFADHINRTTNMRAVLTRTSDYYIPLRDRTQIARRMNADIFISIHADSLTSHADINGMSVYSLSENASDEEAAALANADNKSDIIAGVDLSKQPQYVDTILFDLAQRETNNYSYKFAKILVDEVKKVTKMINKPHRQAGFAVLKAPDLPSVLVELGFLTNSIDERNLNSSTWRRQVVISMTRALLIWKDKKRN